MENLWSLFVSYLQACFFLLSQVYGGNVSLAIITLSFIIRFALMPFTLRIARRNQHRQMRLKAIQPELERIKTRYRNNPEELAKKTMEVYKKHEVQPFDGFGLFGNLVQLPIFAGLFSAIEQGVGTPGRFLWITDISQPNILLAAIVAVLTFVSTALTPNNQDGGRTIFIVLPALLTLFFAWRLSAGLGLYWGVSSLVGIIQTVILRREPLKK
jgi:YidC/Oxa1 family membrane protein insertase